MMRRNEMRWDEIGRELASRTKPYLINLHCQSLPFRIGCILRSRLSDSIGNEFSKVVFEFLIFFTFGKELRKTIKLMFFPKSHVLFAVEGRPVGPIDWRCTMIKRWRCTRWARLEVKWHQVGFWSVRVRERASRHWVHLPPTYPPIQRNAPILRDNPETER